MVTPRTWEAYGEPGDIRSLGNCMRRSVNSYSIYTHESGLLRPEDILEFTQENSSRHNDGPHRPEHGL